VTALEVLLAVAGLSVTTLVVAGMILLTPRGSVAVGADGSDSQGSELSRAGVSDPAAPIQAP
jgi:hypothetical protein